jgi:hypothetical protein
MRNVGTMNSGKKYKCSIWRVVTCLILRVVLIYSPVNDQIIVKFTMIIMSIPVCTEAEAKALSLSDTMTQIPHNRHGPIHPRIVGHTLSAIFAIFSLALLYSCPAI